MKGLLVKDFSLMKMQKNFFITILGIAAFMTVFLKNISFPMGFLPMVISLFTLSTISYDEFDNGNAFLFTFPITRKTYVTENIVWERFSVVLPGQQAFCWALFPS